jgi:hypothetical protein
MHYPAISKIVAQECAKRGVNYSSYDTLPQIISRFVRCAAGWLAGAGAVEAGAVGAGALAVAAAAAVMALAPA